LGTLPSGLGGRRNIWVDTVVAPCCMTKVLDVGLAVGTTIWSYSLWVIRKLTSDHRLNPVG
jgi:hypothetical protein